MVLLDLAEETHSLFQKHWQHCVSSKTQFVSLIQSSSFVVKKLLLLWINLRGSIRFVLLKTLHNSDRFQASCCCTNEKKNCFSFSPLQSVTHIYSNRCPTKHRKDEGNIYIFPSFNNLRNDLFNCVHYQQSATYYMLIYRNIKWTKSLSTALTYIWTVYHTCNFSIHWDTERLRGGGRSSLYYMWTHLFHNRIVYCMLNDA